MVMVTTRRVTSLVALATTRRVTSSLLGDTFSDSYPPAWGFDPGGVEPRAGTGSVFFGPTTIW